MFIPRGFGERAIMTQLGKMVYYTTGGDPWPDTQALEQPGFQSVNYQTCKIALPVVSPHIAGVAKSWWVTACN